MAVIGIGTVAVLGLSGMSSAAATSPTPNDSGASTVNSLIPLPDRRPVTPTVTAAPAPTTKPVPTKTPTSVSESAALARAKATGKSVPVTGDITDTTDVVANPNGTFTLHSHLIPVRTRVNGSWVPIDTTLRTNPDGTMSPIATTEDVRFSGGGTQPLVTLAQGTDAVSLSWPTPLPTPLVQGSSATYLSVLPGVDLVLTADASDYRQVLVVHDATAAANPALAAIHLTATAHDLTVAADAQGLLAATDPTGKPVFHSATPIMWDSTPDPSGTAPTATDPDSGHISLLTVRATQTPTAAKAAMSVEGVASSITSTVDLSIEPNGASLTGVGVRYPVFIDPQWNVNEENWAEVTANGFHYFDANMDAQVGLCTGWPDCGGLTVARSYFQFDTTGLANNPTTATVFSASLFITEDWSANKCTPQPVAIDGAGGIDANTRWPGPDGGNLTTVSSAAGTNCGSPGGIGPANVTGFASQAASGHWTNMVLALRSPDEGNNLQWKKFIPSTAQVDITYAFPPNDATGLAVSGVVTCNGTAYAASANPTLLANATDNNNPPLNPALTFQLSNNNFGSLIAASSPVVIGSGTTGGWTTPTLGPGSYQFRVGVTNSAGVAAPDQPSAGFTVLASPAVAPLIGTGQYPEGYWGESSDNPGAFAIYNAGAANIAGYTWTIEGAGTEPIPDSSQCDYNQTFTGSNGATGGYIADNGGSGVFALPAGLSPGYHVMYARSFDFAHNLSPESAAYIFYVAPPLGVNASGWQEAESLPFSQPAGQNDFLGAQANCCGVTWSGGAQLWFVGAGAGQSFNVTISVPTTATYQLATVLTKAPDYGIVSATLDGTPVLLDGQSQIDNYNPTVTTSWTDLGAAYLTTGQHTFTFTVVGTDASSTGDRYMAGIDGFYVRPTNAIDVSSAPAIQATDAVNAGIAPKVEPNDNGMGFRGEAQLLYPATAANQAVKLTFTAPVEADYALGVDMTQRPGYGQVTFTADDKTALVNSDTGTAPFDGYAAGQRNNYLGLGGLHLTAGRHSITIKVVGKNTASTGFQVGVQMLTVAAINNVTAGSFAAAMNNHGITSDNTATGANLDFQGRALSAQAMTAAGIGPGSTLTTGGVAFAIPAAGSTTTNDNVVADGQTIPLSADQQVNASAIGLLVAATCGFTPTTPTTITYTTGTPTNPIMPSVPDWVTGDNNAATVTLSHFDGGPNSTDLVRGAHLYAIFLPTDPTRTLKSITLPYTGEAGQANTCTLGGNPAAALHVFAIADRPVSYGTAPNSQTWLGAWAGPVDATTTPPGGAQFANQTVRMVVHPNSTGTSTRIRLSNVDATVPVTIDAASIAAQATGAATLTTPAAVTFAGKASVTIPAGGEINSDPITSPSVAGGSGNLTVSLHIAAPGLAQAPLHATSTAGTYIASGNTITNNDGTGFGAATTGDYFLTGIDASSTDNTQGTIAVLGDQTSGSFATALGTVGGSQIPGSVVDVSRTGTSAQDQWRLNDGTGTTAADTGSDGTHPASASGGVTWNNGVWSGDQNGSVTLDGATGFLATTGPVLDTTGNFTVSAWVDPSKLNVSASQTFVTQQGTTSSGFALGYDGTTGRWMFSRTESDTTNPITGRAESLLVAGANTWTHLVGTYNAASGELQLFVNGVDVGTATENAAVASNGPLVIGRGYVNGTAANYATGSVADVRVYQRTLSVLDADDLFDAAPPQQVTPGAGAPSYYNIGVTDNTNTHALPTSPATILDEDLDGLPNLRTVIVMLGTNDVLNNETTQLIEDNITAVLSRNTPYGLANRIRADGTAVHIVLATIPGLGLSQTDPREKAREQLNTDILANYRNYGADGVIDFDQAVAGSTPGQIAPALLTNSNQPNATYYTTLANAVLAALNKIPPGANL